MHIRQCNRLSPRVFTTLLKAAQSTKTKTDSTMKVLLSTTANNAITNSSSHIIMKGDMVHRPSGFWTNQIHKFLNYLHEHDFSCVPKPHGFDEAGNEVVSLMPGEVSNYPLTITASSEKTLVSVAKLLRKYHDVSQGFLKCGKVDDTMWYLPLQEPREVVCHGDFAPYNVVLNGEKAVSIIDFDTCHPGPREWDLAYAIYRWAPIKSQTNVDSFGSLEEQVKRAHIFCNEYGLTSEKRKNLPNVMIRRLEALISFIYQQDKQNNPIYQRHIKDKHHLLYLGDIEYIKSNKNFLIQNI